MSVAAAVLAHNVKANDREALFWECWHSLIAETEHAKIVDNGSTDGYLELGDVPSLTYRNESDITTCGHGTLLCARVAAGFEQEICVLSDDDMFWREGWSSKLVDWWEAAPDTVWLTGCHLEPEYQWNAIHGATQYGGVRGLRRASTGAASWSFRTRDWLDDTKLGGIAKQLPTDVQGWYDVPFCRAISDRQGQVWQIDLADHAGHGRSTWGNQTIEKYGWDLTPVRERLNNGSH